MLEGHENSTRLQKTGISCKTCGVSESFYSSLSVKQFKLEHADHELVEGISATGGKVETGGKVRLLKVMVDLVLLPAFPRPVFTVTGIREDLRTAFVQVIQSDSRVELERALEKGEYLDPASKNTTFGWDFRAISLSEDAKAAMRIVPSTFPAPGVSGSASEEATSPSGREASAASPSGRDHEEAAPPPVVPGGSASPRAVDSAAPPPEPEGHPGPSQELADSATTIEAEGEATAATPKEPARENEPEADGRVRKSRQTREGQEDDEALRISRLLRPSSWKAGPVYTIGAMLDDILTIETSSQEISGALTKRIESAGYTFSGVTVDQGKPVAWFKKKPALSTSSLPDAAGGFVLSAKVSELDRSIEEERTRAQKEKEELEAWLSLLKRLQREAHATEVHQRSPGGSTSESPEITG